MYVFDVSWLQLTASESECIHERMNAYMLEAKVNAVLCSQYA